MGKRHFAIVMLILLGMSPGCGGGAPRLYGTWKSEIGGMTIEFTSTEMITPAHSTKVSYEVKGDAVIVTAKGTSTGMKFLLKDDETITWDLPSPMSPNGYMTSTFRRVRK